MENKMLILVIKISYSNQIREQWKNSGIIFAWHKYIFEKQKQATKPKASLLNLPIIDVNTRKNTVIILIKQYSKSTLAYISLITSKIQPFIMLINPNRFYRPNLLISYIYAFLTQYLTFHNYLLSLIILIYQYVIIVKAQTTTMVNVSEFDEEELPNYKIIILGRSKAGKTKLLTRYKFNTYEDQGSITVGVDNHTVTRRHAKFTYFDTAGQDQYRAIVNSFYRGSDACVLVYDVTSMKSFEEVSYYYNNVKQMVPDALIYIVGCKGDKDFQVTEQNVMKLFKGYRHEVTSSKENINVKQMFGALEQQLLKQKPKGPKSPLRKTLIPKKHRQKKNEDNCCSKS